MTTFDWSGNEHDTLHWPWVSHIRPLTHGYCISGRFVEPFELGGQTIQGGIGFGDFYLATYNDSDELQWVVNSASIWPNGIFVIDMNVSQTGRIALLLSNGPRFTLNGDTIACEQANDWMILSFDPDGGLEWYKVLQSVNGGNPFHLERSELSFDSLGRLWFAATLEESVVVDSDTIEVEAADLFDHVIMQFDPSGGLSGNMFVPGGDPATHSIIGSGLMPHPDGGVLWFGRYVNGATVDGTVLDSAGQSSNGLIMRLDGAIEMVWHRTFGSDAVEDLSAVDLDAGTGKFMLTGNAGNGTVLGPDTLPSDPVTYLFLATMDPSGTIESGQLFSGTATEQTWMLSANNIRCGDGVCYILGHSSALTLFANGTLIGNTDFVARFDADGAQSIPRSIINGIDLLIFPNPTTGPLTLRSDHASIGRFAVTVRNCTGALVHDTEVTFSSGSAQLDLSHLIPGLYSIQFASPGSTFMKNILKE